MNKSSWDDIKFVLAVAESGSVNTAAKALGVTHATVLRRVAAFEQRHGRRIFQRAATGYRLLPGSDAMLAAARAVEDAVFAVDRAVSGADQTLQGPVRITSTDSLSQLVLPKIVADITLEYPQVSISLISANTHLDLARLSADIAVRPTMALSDGLIGRRVGGFDFGVFTTEGSPRRWLRLDGNLVGAKPAQWIKDNIPSRQLADGSDSFLVLQQMLLSGRGCTYLPRFVGLADPRLIERPDLGPRLSIPVWVAGQEDTRENARFRMVRDRLAAGLAKYWAAM